MYKHHVPKSAYNVPSATREMSATEPILNHGLLGSIPLGSG